jgi:predicted nucleic acid-binding protein
MKRYLLDTNVISETRKPKPHGAVISWMASLRSEQIFVPAVTLGELQAGMEIVRERDKPKAEEIEAWIDRLEISAQILPMDSTSFREWARLMQHKPTQLAEDGMIAASARVHGLIVATRDEADFRPFGVPLFNPFRFVD